jgi:hypothetical protein
LEEIAKLKQQPGKDILIEGSAILSVAVRCLVSVASSVLVGLLVGFRPQADISGWLAAIGLLLLVSYAFS